MITVVDYGLGNLGSVVNMLRKIGYPSKVGSSAEDIINATKLILPGVGAFDTGMQHLQASGLLDSLHQQAIIEKVPTLGICLGAQLMTQSSEEGSLPGLGWFDATTVKFDFSAMEGRWPLPNIGWRRVEKVNESALLEGFDEDPRFYFVHSYYIKANKSDIIASTTSYGIDYTCGLAKENLHCAQFHPEKSHKFGMRFLRNFAEMD